jgi:hypothetical protein
MMEGMYICPDCMQKTMDAVSASPLKLDKYTENSDDLEIPKGPSISMINLADLQGLMGPKKKVKKKKGDNMFVRFYKNRGVSGVVQLLKDAVKALGGMFGRIFRAFKIEELYIAMSVGGGDSAETAIQYGKICSAAFPAMGLLVNKMKIKKYSIDISPDFIYGKTEAKLHTKISLRPIKLINAVFVLVFELLFKVVFKLLKHSKAPEEPKVEEKKVEQAKVEKPAFKQTKKK